MLKKRRVGEVIGQLRCWGFLASNRQYKLMLSKRLYKKNRKVFTFF